MKDDFLPEISEVVAFWEDERGYRFLESHPYVMDGRDPELYAEWKDPKIKFADKSWKKGDFANAERSGISSAHSDVKALRDLLAMVESRYGVVLDHIVVKRSENHILVLWHDVGGQFRYSGRAPIAEALVPVQTSESEKGVA
ncbi:MAG: hypothetical protein ABFC24_08640 [Methanoregulaceae archaeon]